MLYWTFIAGNCHDPHEDSPDRVSSTISEHDGPYEFKARIDPEAEAVMLRRVGPERIRPVRPGRSRRRSRRDLVQHRQQRVENIRGGRFDS